MFSTIKVPIPHAMCSIFVTLLTGLLVAASPGTSNSQTLTLKSAPPNPAFLDHAQARASGMQQTNTLSGRPLGHTPHPVGLSHAKRTQSTGAARAAALPRSYDIRRLGWVPPVRDQGDCGSCWTFGAMASVESRLRQRGVASNFSEADLNRYHGFDNAPCDGGNIWMSTAYFARWSGPVSEADVPYPYAAVNSVVNATPGVKVRQHIQGVNFLPDRGTSTDNDTWKSAVMQSGATDVSFMYDDAYYNEDTYSYWNGKDNGANHEVAIIGWDDNYPKENFKSIEGQLPAGDGAFLIRNSWGAGWGNKGYFYISYYDTSLQEAASFKKIAAPTNYSHVYEYDHLGWVDSLGVPGYTTMWGANVFTASANARYIKAVSFYTTAENTTVRIRIYKNLQNSSPTSGAFVGSVVTTFPFAGYHTVDFPTAMPVKALKKFSAVVSFTTQDYAYPLPVEYAYAGYSSAATAYEGESFYSLDGTNWNDLTGFDPTANACIKVFANEAP